MIAALFAVVAPVFICSALGFCWAKANQPFPMDFVTRIVTALGTPCLILSSLLKLKVTPDAFTQMVFAAILVFVLVGIAGAFLLVVLKLPFHSYLPALLFPNSGNMGLPLSLFAFGDAGLALAIAFFSVAAVSQFTIGVGLAAGSVSFKQLVRTPLLYAVGFGLVAMTFDIEVPLWLLNTVNLVGGLTIPLMLIALGVSLAQLRVTSIGRSVIFSCLRIGFGLAAAVIVGQGLDLKPLAQGVLLLQSAMPVAVFNYLFASRYKREPEEVASMVLISTALIFIVLPGLLILILPAR